LPRIAAVAASGVAAACGPVFCSQEFKHSGSSAAVKKRRAFITPG